MELIADGLLIAGAFSAGFYCWMLSRRLKALKSLDSGLGKSIALLSRQVEEIGASVEAVRRASDDKNKELVASTARAEMVAGRLELLLASIHEGESKVPVGAEKVQRNRKRRLTEKTAPEAESENSQEALLSTLRHFVEGAGK